jgi:hypothetical protein
VTTIPVPVQLCETINQPNTQGIQMYITDKLLEIEVFFTYDRFVTILKQVPVSSMATIIGNSITG